MAVWVVDEGGLGVALKGGVALKYRLRSGARHVSGGYSIDLLGAELEFIHVAPSGTSPRDKVLRSRLFRGYGLRSAA